LLSITNRLPKTLSSLLKNNGKNLTLSSQCLFRSPRERLPTVHCSLSLSLASSLPPFPFEDTRVPPACLRRFSDTRLWEFVRVCFVKVVWFVVCVVVFDACSPFVVCVTLFVFPEHLLVCCVCCVFLRTLTVGIHRGTLWFFCVFHCYYCGVVVLWGLCILCCLCCIVLGCVRISSQLSSQLPSQLNLTQRLRQI
jgi:hypothetical protein